MLAVAELLQHKQHVHLPKKVVLYHCSKPRVEQFTLGYIGLPVREFPCKTLNVNVFIVIVFVILRSIIDGSITI